MAFGLESLWKKNVCEGEDLKADLSPAYLRET